MCMLLTSSAEGMSKLQRTGTQYPQTEPSLMGVVPSRFPQTMQGPPELRLLFENPSTCITQWG